MRTLRTCLLIGLLVSLAQAQQPNFTGKFERVSSNADKEKGSALPYLEMTVKQDGNALLIHQDGAQGVYDIRLTVDNKPTTNKWGHRTATSQDTAQIKGKSLRVQCVVKTGQLNFTETHTWKLSDDAKTLAIKHDVEFTDPMMKGLNMIFGPYTETFKRIE